MRALYGDRVRVAVRTSWKVERLDVRTRAMVTQRVPRRFWITTARRAWRANGSAQVELAAPTESLERDQMLDRDDNGRLGRRSREARPVARPLRRLDDEAEVAGRIGRGGRQGGERCRSDRLGRQGHDLAGERRSRARERARQRRCAPEDDRLRRGDERQRRRYRRRWRRRRPRGAVVGDLEGTDPRRRLTVRRLELEADSQRLVRGRVDPGEVDGRLARADGCSRDLFAGNRVEETRVRGGGAAAARRRRSSWR